MNNAEREEHDKIRRSITHEIIRIEDDFDETRILRKKILGKLSADIERINVVDADGKVTDDTTSAIAVYNTLLKTLSDIEKASVSSANVKIKQKENEIASSAAAQERIAIVLQATAPGATIKPFPKAELDKLLDDKFGEDIPDYETRTSHRDLDD